MKNVFSWKKSLSNERGNCEEIDVKNGKGEMNKRQTDNLRRAFGTDKVRFD
jgi:hypothetical protein